MAIEEASVGVDARLLLCHKLNPRLGGQAGQRFGDVGGQAPAALGERYAAIGMASSATTGIMAMAIGEPSRRWLQASSLGDPPRCSRQSARAHSTAGSHPRSRPCGIVRSVDRAGPLVRPDEPKPAWASEHDQAPPQGAGAVPWSDDGQPGAAADPDRSPDRAGGADATIHGLHLLALAGRHDRTAHGIPVPYRRGGW